MIRTPADGSRRPGLALVGLCLFAAFSLGYGNFLGSDNLNAIALSSAFVLIASIGTMALLVSGNVDLSIGSQYALISVVTALVVLHTGSALLGVVAALSLGLLLGLVNGLLVLVLGVSPLIVTLAMLGIYGGLAYVAGAGNTVFGLPGSFTVIGSATVLGVPVPVIVAVCAFLAGAWVLVATITGLRLYAVGGNRTASALVGVRANRLVAGTFAANGALIGLVALLSTAQLASGSPQVGVGFELSVLAAVILGGVAFTGGRGHPLGVLVSVATIGVLNTGLIFAGLADWYQQIAQGMLLLVALAADHFLVVRRERRIRQGFSPPPAARQEPIAEHRRRTESGLSGVVVDVKDVTVRFAGVLALDAVNLSVSAGEVVCLVGDNGAGKSTLAKTICGAVRPAVGEVTLNGQKLTAEPSLARRAGVETVFQELALCPDLNVADNLALGREPRAWIANVLPVRDVRAAERTARARLDELGIELADLRRPVRLLSGGERQLVQILRVMRTDVSLVILDEPTSALGLNQATEVRALARAIAAAGTPVLMITHDVEEVFELADRVAVLQRGQLIFDGPITSVSRLELLRMMSGKARVEAARIMDAVSSERKRIERDLHDGAQQGLVQAALTLGLATVQLRKSGNDSVAALLDSGMETLRTALAELRDLSRGLYPSLLSEEGLVPAVEVLLTRSTVPVDLRADELPRLGEPVEIAAYFVVAEALTNVLKHARASRVTIDISYDGRQLAVSITDDGIGSADEGGGSGLRGLRDRVGAVDGTFAVSSTPGEGTTVAASFPVAEAVSIA
jgi:ribose/xylose/arabinose/galactoside ABC-type transport system permease subunit/ABC-type glutathione transport system ATPase component